MARNEDLAWPGMKNKKDKSSIVNYNQDVQVSSIHAGGCTYLQVLLRDAAIKQQVVLQPLPLPGP